MSLALREKRRGMAHKATRRNTRLSRGSTLCQRHLTVAVPQLQAVTAYHFRTPSPIGQPHACCMALPEFFAPIPADWRVSANTCPARHFALSEPSSLSCVLFKKEAGQGQEQCLSKLGFPQVCVVPALRHVATRSVNRPLSAVPSVQVPQPSQAAACCKVPPLVRRATCYTARRNRASASNPRPARGTRGRYSRDLTPLNSIVSPQATLMSPAGALDDPTDTTDFRGNGGSIGRSKAVVDAIHLHAARTKPRSAPLITSDHRHHASGVLLPQGAFLRCSTPQTRDVSCSTRS